MNFSNLNNSDWQNFIYLAILLTFIVAGIFSRRDIGWQKIVKYLAIWLAVGFVAIALYAYRFDFADFKNRIKGEISPTTAQIIDNKIIINIAEDGHFYIDLKINSVPVRFMIDTGASDITINISEAKRIGLDVKNLTFNRPYQTANGVSWGASVILREIEIGDIKFHDVKASVNNADMGISLLGMHFLRQFSRYEFYRDKLVLTL